jgi:O-antigen ligase
MMRGEARMMPLAVGAAATAGGALTAATAYASRPAIPLVALAAAAAVALAATMPIQLLYVAILLIPFKLFTIDLGGAGLSLPEGLFVLSGVAWAVRRVLSGAWPAVPSPLGKPYAALLLAIVPGIVIALHPFPVVKTLVMWTAFFLVYQMVVDDGRPETVQRILLALAVSAAIVGLGAAVAPGTPHPEKLLGVGAVATGRPGGSFDDPNILATFEALGLPAAVALAFGRSVLLRGIGAVAVALILAGLALSLSRGGFLAAAGVLLVMLTWRPFRYAAAAGLVVMVGFWTASGTVIGEVQQTSVVAGRIQSVSYAASGGDPRFAIWRTTPEMIAEHPFFGIGENQYPEVSLRYGLYAEDLGGSYQHAHNIPLTIGAETGILGLAALTWVAFALARVLLGACRRLRGYERGMATALAAAFTGLALQGMVDYTVSSNTVAAVIFVLAGCAVVMWRAAPEPQASPDAASA